MSNEHNLTRKGMGRPKGAKNIMQSKLRCALEDFTFNKLQGMEELWNSLSPKDKAWVLVKLTSLLVPKAKEDEKEAVEAQKIEINYIIPNASN